MIGIAIHSGYLKYMIYKDSVSFKLTAKGIVKELVGALFSKQTVLYLQQQKGKGLTHSIELDAKIRFLNSFSSYCLSPFHSFCVRGLSPPLAWKFLESRHWVLLCVSCAWPVAQGSRRGGPELSWLTW